MVILIAILAIHMQERYINGYNSGIEHRRVAALANIGEESESDDHL